MTPEEIKALRETVKAGNAAREQKLQQFRTEAELTRLKNEKLLLDLESKTGRTLGIDLGVIWCPDGSMCVVSKPELIDYEKFQTEIGDAEGSEAKAKLLDEYLKPSLVHPKPGRDFDELCERYGEVRGAAVLTINKMHDVTQEKTTGKS